MLWNMLFGLCILGIERFGDYIEECPQGKYACPNICEVNHEHYPRKECNGEAEQESKSDSTTVQPIEQLHEKTVATDKSKRL